MHAETSRRILITGGTGRLGRELVPRCRDRGWAVRVMSRRAAPAGAPEVEWATADLATGAGLEAAVADVDVVAHLASLPYRGRRTDKVDIGGTARLVHAAGTAGVSHLVFISIVGVDAIPWPYFGKKLAAEERVRRGAVPWSIVRATQFFPFVDAVLTAAARPPVVLGPTDVPGRPVDPRDVAERLVELIAAGPSRAGVSYAGPDVMTLAQIADQWMQARGRRRPVVRLPMPGRLGRALREGKAVPAEGGVGTRTWRAWLEETARA
jgi:uncharacterized protein YbjT (DUF2867 family)